MLLQQYFWFSSQSRLAAANILPAPEGVPNLHDGRYLESRQLLIIWVYWKWHTHCDYSKETTGTRKLPQDSYFQNWNITSQDPIFRQRKHVQYELFNYYAKLSDKHYTTSSQWTATHYSKSQMYLLLNSEATRFLKNN